MSILPDSTAQAVTATHVDPIVPVLTESLVADDDAESVKALNLIDLAKAATAGSRPMTAWERKVTDEFFWSQFA